MSQFYDEMLATAREMIDEFGQDIVFTRRGANRVYDPAEGTWSGSDDDTTKTVRGLVLSPASKATESYATKLGYQNIQIFDQVLLVQAGEYRPDLQDTATFKDSEAWQIVDIDPLSPAGTDLLYWVLARP